MPTPSLLPTTPSSPTLLPSLSPSGAPSPTPSPTSGPIASLDPATAALDALLPKRIAGVDYTMGGYTIPVEQDVAGGDACFGLFCPGELSAYAKELGIASGPITVAAVVPSDQKATSVVWIVAIRLPGADRTKLVSAWIRHYTSVGLRSPTLDQRSIAGKRVTLVWPGVFANAYQDPFVYAHADVLYVVRTPLPQNAQPHTLVTPPVVVEAFGLLP